MTKKSHKLGAREPRRRAGRLQRCTQTSRGAQPGLEQILETCYSLSLTFDCQFIANPGYNIDRGLANVFAARVQAQF